MPWFFAMFAILPLMTGRTRIRTWGAVMASSLVAWALPGHSPELYMLIDLACGAMVLVRPAGGAQRAIGLLFAFMAVFDIGFMIGGRANTPDYVAMLIFLGWLQFAILLTWGLYDRLGHILGSAWAGWYLRAHPLGRR